MNDVHLLGNEQSSSPISYIDELFNKIEKILHDHRQNDPDYIALLRNKS